MPCSTASWHVPTTARIDGQRLARTIAAAADRTTNTPAAPRSGLTAEAIVLIAGTSCRGSGGRSSARRGDSFACASSAAFAGPHGPSHHHKISPLDAPASLIRESASGGGAASDAGSFATSTSAYPSTI